MLLHTDRHRGQARDSESIGGTDAREAGFVDALRALRDDAWSELYRRHAGHVYSYIYFRIGDQHTAEDLTAEVFIKAIGGIKGYTWRGKPLLAWLYRIAHNVTVDHRKANARRAQHQASQAPEDIRERADALQDMNERSDMMRAIRELTEDQQQVIVLRFYQGMSNAEVASVMGKPEGAVKALQSRGLRSLRRLLIAADEREQTA